ncbi:MAG: hypothetical protein OJF60_001084 [Burkholderiaceae bacterium]|jgi:hypothetical protein|nr:MAG: hypothetical protein OJF60_001084 [Burkholderiaceae bacterium]
MKYLVALPSWAMPVVAWLSNAGVFGPTNGAISNEYSALAVVSSVHLARVPPAPRPPSAPPGPIGTRTMR